MMRVLDLFSGIGGFSLGLERAGMRTVAFCEIDPFCRRVLAKHWPGVPCYDDVRTLTAERLAADGIGVDLICGGFPCQDISTAGKGAGIDGERSGLWSEYSRIIGELRPRYVIVENVAALLGRGLARVLGDLAALGFDAEWHCIPASAVGAPHRRDRLWIIAEPHRQGKHAGTLDAEMASIRQVVAHTNRERTEYSLAIDRKECETERHLSCGCSADVADPGEPRLSSSEPDALLGAGRWREGGAASECGWWSIEPDVGGMVDGLSARIHGGLDADEMDGAQTSATGNTVDAEYGLPSLWGARRIGAASPGLCSTEPCRDSVPDLPHQSRPTGRTPPDETHEGVQGLWQGVHAETQQETQYLQPRMPIGSGASECNETLGQWAVEPDIPRVAKGVKDRVNRLRSLGNAVVPQIPEIIGRAILRAAA